MAVPLGPLFTRIFGGRLFSAFSPSGVVYAGYGTGPDCLPGAEDPAAKGPSGYLASSVFLFLWTAFLVDLFGPSAGDLRAFDACGISK